MIAPKFGFHQAGQAGTWISDLLPHTSKQIDDICLIRSMHTEAINHDPAITFMQSGSQQPGRPSLGAWLSYGLGSDADDLPAFIVLISHGSGKDANQGLMDRLWGSGFLPSSYQGVKLRSSGDPVLYLTDPPGIDREMRRNMLDGIAKLNARQLASRVIPRSRLVSHSMRWRSRCRPLFPNSRTSAPNRRPHLTCMAKRPKSPELLPRTACSRDVCSNAECAAYSCIIVAGINMEACRPTCPSRPTMSISLKRP